MATIPLPALHVDTQQQSPLDLYAKAQQIKGMQQQQQLVSTEVQQRQLQLQDQQATTAAMKEWDGKDPDALPPLVLKNGGSSTAVFGLKNQIMDWKTKAANLSKEQLETLDKTNEIIAGHFEAVKNAKDKPTAYTSAMNDLQQQGLVKPGQYPDQYPGDDWLDIEEKKHMGQKAIVEEANKKQELANKAQELDIEAKKFASTQPGGATENPEQRYIRLKAKQDSGKELTPDEQSQLKATTQYQLIKPAFTVNNLTGGALGPGGGAGGGAPAQKTINDVPQNIRGQVQAVLDYRSPMPPQGRNNPVNAAVRNWVQNLDPKYDETQYANRATTLRDFQKDADSGQLGAINTALGHAGELYQAAKALSQNDLPLLHNIASKVGAATGSDAPTTYQMILHRVAPEMTAAYVKGGGGEGERGANEADFELSKGAKQIQSNIAEAVNLLNSKLDSKRKAWNTGFNPTQDKDQFDNRFMTDSAKATLQTLSAKSPIKAAPKVGDIVTLKGKKLKITAIHPDGTFDADPQ